jgi:hypothetical protein
MKRIIFLIVLVIFVCLNPLQADNRVMILTDTLYMTLSGHEIVIGFENDTALQGLSNGFRIRATGASTANFIYDAAYIDNVSRGGVLNSLPFAFIYHPMSSQCPDTVLTGIPWL